MPNLPTSVKIGPHEYVVERKFATEMGDDLGKCEPDENLIALRNRLPLNKAQEILLHEILHACTYPSLYDKVVQDEQFVEAVAPVLLQVLQDNPHLVEYLCHTNPKPKNAGHTPQTEPKP